jgi:hypothetical protein
MVRESHSRCDACHQRAKRASSTKATGKTQRHRIADTSLLPSRPLDAVGWGIRSQSPFTQQDDFDLAHSPDEFAEMGSVSSPELLATCFQASRKNQGIYHGQGETVGELCRLESNLDVNGDEANAGQVAEQPNKPLGTLKASALTELMAQEFR